MNRAEAILAQLAARQPVAARVMIAAAHPDDETLGLGAQLCRLEDALIVHLTDGAPRDGRDAAARGFAALADYAAARRGELAAALAEGGAERARTRCLGLADQEAVRSLAPLSREIADLIRQERPHAVFTHAYEGGHPDHDAAAFAVHAACGLLDDPPAIIEFALYHRQNSRLVTGQFLPTPSLRKPGSTEPPSQPPTSGSRPSPGRRVCEVSLSEEGIRRKQRMIECFATQVWLLKQFGVAVERFRPAPNYDFRQPPHPGELHYETLGWGITGADWRRAAEAALAELGLD